MVFYEECSCLTSDAATGPCTRAAVKYFITQMHIISHRYQLKSRNQAPDFKNII